MTVSDALQRQSTVQTLRELCDQQQTGELICVTSKAEFHIYLQRGRLAWATDSTSRHIFAEELVKRGNIDPDAFREVLEECRRSRRKIGETIVQWGLATKEQVRGALEVQVSKALLAMLDEPQASSLFLKRGQAFESYDPELTFEVRGVLGSLFSLEQRV